jgi:hypothetical protein
MELKIGHVVKITQDFQKYKAHYTTGRIGVITEVSVKTLYKSHFYYKLNVLYDRGRHTSVFWYDENMLIYVCESINDLTELDRLIYDLGPNPVIPEE